MDEKTIWKTYSPKLNPWFSSELVYEGQGTAFFENPAGKVEGKTVISIDELGEIKVDMEYARLDTNAAITSESESFRILKFLYQHVGEAKYPDIIAEGEKNKNPCSKLIVETQDGTFVSTGNISWATLDARDGIIFWISRGLFEVNNAREPKYWVLPLTNFVSYFPWNNHPLLVNHPMRLYQTPTVPEMSDERQKAAALFAATNKNSLVGFEFSKKPGFIERMPDYAEREEKLKSKQVRQCITALMVGEISDAIKSRWFPYEWANLLSFASGTEVGASWLELRDSEGKLVNRKHFPTLKTTYEKGYAVIDEFRHGGLGYLISLASNSPEFSQSYFRILINQLTHANLQNHAETRMTILSRAFEGLFEFARKLGLLEQQSLMSNLPEHYRQEVKTILDKASSEIENLYLRSNKENLSNDVSYSLERIEKKIENANNTDGDFGMKVLKLLDLYKLPDTAIMEQHFFQEVGKSIKSWAGFLSMLRNAPIHQGYFAIQDGIFDWEEIINAQDHLHDILVRIVLKILGYDGKYQPKVIDVPADGKTIDWVTENTSAEDLGYERKRFG